MADCSLLITDYNLTDGISLEFVRDLREKFPNAAVLIVTGDHGVAEELKAIGDPRSDVLTKPFIMDDAMKVILALTARAAQ
jgi:DNA-binding response OmpR family regulator